MLREINHELVNASSMDSNAYYTKRSASSRVKSPASCPVTIAAPQKFEKTKKKSFVVSNSEADGGKRDEDELELNGASMVPKLHAFARKVVKVVSSFAKNGRYTADEEETEEDLVNPSPLSWHKNCKTTFGIASNSEKGTKISVFDRRRSVMEILEQMSSSGGTVPSAPFSPSASKVTKKRGAAAPVSLLSAPCSTPSVANETTVAMAFRPDHPNEIAVTTKESGGVRLFSKVLSSFASNNNNSSSASDVTTWKIERLPNDETETLLDSAVSDVIGVRVLDKLAWSPDGSLLATASSRGSTIRIWDVNAKKSTAMSSGNMSGLSSVIRSIKRRKMFRVPK